MAALLQSIHCALLIHCERVQIPVGTPDPESGVVHVEKDGEQEVTKSFEMLCTPLCLTVGLYKGQRIVDLTFEEQQIVTSSVAVIVRDAETLLGANILLGLCYNGIVSRRRGRAVTRKPATVTCSAFNNRHAGSTAVQHEIITWANGCSGVRAGLYAASEIELSPKLIAQLVKLAAARKPVVSVPNTG